MAGIWTRGRSNRSVQWPLALAYELAGRRTEALAALESAIRLGQPANEVHNEPALEALRQDARYARLAAR